MTAKTALSHMATMEGISSGRCIFVWMNSDFMIEWMSNYLRNRDTVKMSHIYGGVFFVVKS
ncbi:hypothetical protein HMPREF9163_00787 [Selenomonas sp. oral taxon 138 str. F0429]|nr:hypothetical protein HMPREF9163_00787 [Selenomonas sp. oral taxon 138 str. F0429]